MKDWFKRFFAVDNSINEQSVVGVFWMAVSLALLILKVVGVPTVGLDVIGVTVSASLLSFGIAGFKRV